MYHIHGSAKDSKILPVKVLNAAGGGDVASIIAGIYYAADNGANVINASLQRLKQRIPALTEAVKYAESKNVVFISASGNDGLDLSLAANQIYPGELEVESLINVAALGSNNLLTSYSNFGAEQVDVAVPGGDQSEPIYSLATLNTKNIAFVPSGGTSMAAPIVAGVVALLLEANPYLTPLEVKNILMQSGTNIEGLTDVVGSGQMIDASKAIDQAANTLLMANQN